MLDEGEPPSSPGMSTSSVPSALTSANANDEDQDDEIPGHEELLAANQVAMELG